MDNKDKLSGLPDGVLLAIVSFLPFKEAVRTSVLSRKWRRIPVGTRNLEFDERDFAPKAADSDHEARQNKRRAFLDFVTGWIGNYQESVGPVKFGLAFSHPEDHRAEVEHLVGFAIGCRVKVLDLDFSDPEWDDNIIQHHQAFLRLPMIDDEHKRTLESLRLFSCSLPQISQASQNFAALKSVHLGWIEVPSASIKTLMEKCPALETLSTKNCSYGDYFEVIGPRLETLVLEKCSGADPGTMMLSSRIDAPKLRVFKYSGVLNRFDCEVVGSVEEADLDFGLHGEYGEYGDILYELLVDIASVRTLTVCSYMLQVIPSGEEPFKLKPHLGRVNHLILKTSLDRSVFYGITFFFNSCPNLEVLTVDLTSPTRIFPEYDPPFKMREHAFLYTGPYQPISYACVRSKLKSVIVEGFKGEPNELMVLGYLLKHGRALQELHIRLSKERGPDGESMEETYVKKVRSLQNFQVASEELRILLRRK